MLNAGAKFAVVVDERKPNRTSSYRRSLRSDLHRFQGAAVVGLGNPKGLSATKHSIIGESMLEERSGQLRPSPFHSGSQGIVPFREVESVSKNSEEDGA